MNLADQCHMATVIASATPIRLLKLDPMFAKPEVIAEMMAVMDALECPRSGRVREKGNADARIAQD